MLRLNQLGLRIWSKLLILIELDLDPDPKILYRHLP